jgi:HPr kinase/phosphorylase
MSETLSLHATTVSLNGTAVMIRGASGMGKSDLALQLLESTGNGLTGQPINTVLVADDQTILSRRGEIIYASCPDTIAGLLEVRGHDVLQVEAVQNLPLVLVLVVDLRPSAQIERLPQPEDMLTQILGLAIPNIMIDPAKASAASRLRVAWARLALKQKQS